MVDLALLLIVFIAGLLLGAIGHDAFYPPPPRDEFTGDQL